MSTTELEPKVRIPSADNEARLPDARDLEDQVPPQFKLSRTSTLLTLTLGLVFLTFALRPIFHTDIWGHVAYGQMIWSLGRLPAEEPLLPLARGMPFVDTAWLSQLLSYGVLSQWGLAGLQGLTAISVTLTCAAVLWRSLVKTHSFVFGLAALAVVLWFDWTQLIVVRPQLYALACFTLLLAKLTGKPHRSDWITIPLLMLVWTNLHGSFPVGLGLMAAFTLGRAMDVLYRTGRWQALTHDSRLTRLTLLTELAFAATLINPYGPYLYREVWSFGSNPNLVSLTEWQTLDIRSWTGGTLLALLSVLAVVYRLTPRRVAAWEALTLIGLTAATFWSSRMLAWLSPVAAYLLAVHAHAIWRGWRQAPLIPEPLPRAGLWTVATIGLAWICFGYSPVGLKLIHGRDPKPERALTEYTPLGAVEYLKEFPPTGQVFNIYEWGDFLHWAGPPGLKIFVNSHAHNVPTEVWDNYLRVINLENGWHDALDRYGVNTVIVDRAVRDRLIKALKDDANWKVGYEDHVATVFIRKKPI